MRRRWKVLSVTVIMVLISAVAFAALRSVPELPLLQTYTSPPLDTRGTRVQVVHPVGWRLTDLRPDPKGAPHRQEWRYIYMTFRADRQSTLFEEAARFIKRSPRSYIAEYIDVQILPGAVPPREQRPSGKEHVSVITRASPGIPKQRVYISQRDWLPADNRLWFSVRYVNTREAEFEATHEAVSRGVSLER